ncbi:hypothetical protein CHS0354_041958 [Potamilus streckersoni]|uniref:Cadherin domain-containing protein n=1 Tax=Potamilus streckersoni TaxID=2493646 RepID=A0AAE0T9N8_9BIVA|nr:hypothetical protein CHS0354_041958 [Potamilus streckersoni]
MFITIILERLMLWSVFSLSFVNYVHGNLVYTLQEELPGITVLGNVARDSGLRNQTGVTLRIFQSFQYVLITSGHLQLSRIFEVEPSTSDLKAKGTVDRELMCPNSDICLLSFKVGANSVTVGFYTIINIVVNVTDCNDNAPTFPLSLVELTIQENTPIRESFPLDVVATDHDAGINSVQKYQIVPDSEQFGLEDTDEEGGTHFLTLVIKQLLDRETQGFYQIVVIALDGGMPPKTGMLTINITVTDVNDNRPRFSQNSYNVTIDEKVAINSVILRVSATDADEGKNGKVTYSLTLTDTVYMASFIALNASTGEVTLLKSLVFNPTLVYKAYIHAQDSGSPVKSARTSVFIYLRYSNKTAPVINVNFLFSGQLSENALVNAAVVYIDLTYTEWDLHAQVTCTCNPCGNFGIRQLGTDVYTLNVVKELDREQILRYNVTIACSDSETPSLNTTKIFVIEIKDENDNAPVFEQAFYIINVNENNAPGETLIKVKATDADVDVNGEILYTFASGLGNNGFTIGPIDGIIRVKVQLDRESQAQYSFYVFAQDNGQDKQLTSSTLVTINVLDLNDVYPIFNQSSYTMSLMENQNSSVPVYIGQVFAVDTDEGENARISYLISTDYETLPYRILQNGIIIVTESLDREKISNYTFEVIAYDNGNIQKSSTVSVTVNVCDINDNEPIFLFPSYDNNTIIVEMSTKPKTVITTIIASDSDTGNNKRLSYDIVAGNTNHIFQVDNNTGDIILSRIILESYLGSHDLIVSAKDHGVPEHCNRTVLNVIFFKSNITAPLESSNLPTTGQTIVIIISISSVTFVISVVIIIVICFIRNTNEDKHVYSPRIYETQKMIHSSTRHINRSNVFYRSEEEMIPMAKGFAKKSEEKDMNFPGEDIDGFNSSSTDHTSVYNTSLSTFKSSQKQLSQIQGQAQPSTSQPFPGKYSTEGERDFHSDDTWETTTSDSGCDGSDEDVISCTTNSNEPDKNHYATAV